MKLAHISVGEPLEMYYSSKYMLAIEDEATHYRELPHMYQARDILEEFNMCYQFRKLKELTGMNEWERKMIQINRKTLVVCNTCYGNITGNIKLVK